MFWKNLAYSMRQIWRRAFRVRLFLLVHAFTTLVAAGGGWIIIYIMENKMLDHSIPLDSVNKIITTLHWGIFGLILAVLLTGSFFAISIIRPIHNLTERLQLLRSGKQLRPVYFPNLKDFDALNEIFSDLFRHWQHLFDSRANEIFFMINNKFHIVECSLSTEFFLGYTLEEIKRSPLIELFPQIPQNAKFYESLAKKQVSDIPFELFAQHKNGYHIPLKARIMPDKNSAFEYPVIFCYPEEKIESELQKRLEFSNQILSLGMMANQIAHEIRNPLGAIKGMAQLLDEESNEELRRQYTKVIVWESERLNQLIEKILLLSRNRENVAEPVNLFQFLQERIEVLAVNFPQATFTLSGDKKMQLQLFAKELPHLFDNLLINAVQHAKPGTAVEIYLQKQGNSAEIAIKNQGEPIPDSAREQLFRPFFSLRERGNGLGLAIARKAALLHNGEIRWKNEADGVCFTVMLPNRS